MDIAGGCRIYELVAITVADMDDRGSERIGTSDSRFKDI